MCTSSTLVECRCIYCLATTRQYSYLRKLLRHAPSSLPPPPTCTHIPSHVHCMLGHDVRSSAVGFVCVQNFILFIVKCYSSDLVWLGCKHGGRPFCSGGNLQQRLGPLLQSCRWKRKRRSDVYHRFRNGKMRAWLQFTTGMVILQCSLMLMKVSFRCAGDVRFDVAMLPKSRG